MPNTETIIIECISTDEGQVCTTGDATLDNQLYGGSQVDAIGYKFEGLFAEDGSSPLNQPIPGNASGALPPMEWQDSTPLSHDRKFLGLNLVLPREEPLGLGGQQLDSFDFENTLQKCAIVEWDPAGRIFDSQSLEPVTNASVTLLKKRGDNNFSYVNPADPNDVPGGALINPYPPTKEDGWFSFVVIDGTYKLNVQSATHRFPSSGTLNSNYSKIYSNIYPSQTGTEIVQAGALQYRDIPVDSIGAPTNSPPKIMEYSYESDLVSSLVVIGKVSHPLSVINLYSVIPDENDPEIKVRYRLITTTTADKNGRFSATVDQSTFDSEVGEIFGEVEATKVDLTLVVKNNNKAQTSSSTTLKLDPIPTYLEGYAYDSQGRIMPNTKVGVYLNFAKKAYYETTTDINGYFKVNSDYIPFQPYKLKYSTPTGLAITVSTGKFLTDNKIYLKENNISAFKPNYIDPKINEKIKVKLTERAVAANNSSAEENVVDSNSTNKGSVNLGLIAMVAFVVLFLIAAIAVVVFMIKSKRGNPY